MPERADALARGYEARLAEATPPARRPRVYFEEWDAPMISGIGWVSELIGLAGGDDVFPERARMPTARDRIVTGDAVIGRRPT